MKYWLETLGCPKNQVDSDKIEFQFQQDGYEAAEDVEQADLVVVNTCAFIEAARVESIEAIVDLEDRLASGARLVVTGCMAERYKDELQQSLGDNIEVSGFGIPITKKPKKDAQKLDLLNLPRKDSPVPWGYLKVAEGCNRNCGFCAIPSFRGKQVSRNEKSILDEAETMSASEIVLVAQDIGSYGIDLGKKGAIIPLLKRLAKIKERVRLLYLYPSDLSEELIETMCDVRMPYFDLSLQHVSRPLIKRMRRYGDGSIFAERIKRIRSIEPNAAFRSNFIVGYPGETEEDHELLVRFVEEQQMEWVSFFAYSDEEGTVAHDLSGHVPQSVIAARMSELTELQDRITASVRAGRVGQNHSVLVDEPGLGRSFMEAPLIDGNILVDKSYGPGEIIELTIKGSSGPDLLT